MSSESLQEHIVELADQCVKCGLCLPHCPTYALDADETESPRGRIALAQALASGELAGDGELRAHLDHCLGCLACERVCPSQVRYGELLVATRAMQGPRPGRPAALLHALTRPGLLRTLLSAARGMRLSRWLPRGLLSPAHRAALAIGGRRPGRRTARWHAMPAQASPRARVALFPGCVAHAEDRAAEQASRTLLHAAGFAVETLPAGCCGALDRHDGDAARARRLAARTQRQWSRRRVGTVLTPTPGCLGTLRAALPDAEVHDVLGFLAENGESLRFRALPQRVVLHQPCSQTNVARNTGAVAALLRRIPALEVRELPQPPDCCGAAGSHMLQFPERAERLRAPMLRSISEAAPQRLLSANIGCRLHLAVGLAAHNEGIVDEHPLTLLARQLETP